MSEDWGDCPALGPGWKRRVTVRKSGASRGRVDIQYQSPTGEILRSKNELSWFLGPSHDLRNFDFKRGLECSRPPKESRQMAPAGRAPCGAPPPRPGGASGRGDSGRGPAPTGSDPTSPPPPAHLQAVPPGPPPGGHGNVRPPPAPAHPQVVPPGPPPGGHSSVLHRLPEPLPGRVSPHRVPLALPHLPPGAIPLLLLLRAFISSPSACSPSAFSLCFNSSSSSSSSSFPFYSCSSSFHSYSPSSSPSYSPSSFHS
ncbi:uncharacterized protein LOC141917531 isoform X2 [Strix aluco]|uniref:uncharacterized protein LOC141917531 isoform X2 n=1 Tax=Strix aluco TaxID=111821 RepID=UPI003DA68659